MNPMLCRCEDGSLYIISDGKNVQDRKYSHAGCGLKTLNTGKQAPVCAIYHDEQRGLLLTGSKEGSVRVWCTKALNSDPVSYLVA